MKGMGFPASWAALEWLGKDVLERNGQPQEKCHDVYVYDETDEPLVGTVKEGIIGRHLTCAPLLGVDVGPQAPAVHVQTELLRSAPGLVLTGEEMSLKDGSTLCLYSTNNRPAPRSMSGGRPVRRERLVVVCR